MGKSLAAALWIALLRLPKDAYLHFTLAPYCNWLLFLLSFVGYIFLYKRFKKLREETLRIKKLQEDSQPQLHQKEKREKSRFKKVYIFIGCLAAGLLMLNTVLTSAWLLVISIIILQILFLFTVIIRRGRMPVKDVVKDTYEMPLDYRSIQEWQAAEHKQGNDFSIGIWEKILYNANIPQKEKWFFITYNCIAAITFII